MDANDNIKNTEMDERMRDLDNFFIEGKLIVFTHNAYPHKPINFHYSCVFECKRVCVRVWWCVWCLAACLFAYVCEYKFVSTNMYIICIRTRVCDCVYVCV